MAKRTKWKDTECYGYAKAQLLAAALTGYRAAILIRIHYRGGSRIRYCRQFQFRFDCRCGIRHKQIRVLGTVAFVCHHCGAVYRTEWMDKRSISESWSFSAVALQIEALPERDPLLKKKYQISVWKLS